MNIEEVFEKYSDDFLEFKRVENKRSTRADLHAFLLLDSLVQGTDDMVSAAEHDEIFLAVGPEQLAEVATEEQVLELIRCGLRLDTYSDSLAMFT